jgi:serine/threonine protein kinase
MSLLAEKEILGDRYEIISKLGEGAMGVVYEAIDLVQQQRCAIKILKNQNMSDARQKRFDEEGRCIALLNSPHIVKFYEIGVNPKGIRFVVMEKLEGECLSELMLKRKLSELEGIYIILGVLEALSVVHQANLVHRDLKPANIFICQKKSHTANVKLLDFGIVKDLSTDSHITATNIWVGTPKYMSPEAFDPKQSFCKESDLYAVGILLYMFISGSFPYELEDFAIPHYLQKMPAAVKISWLHLNGNPKPLNHPLNPLILKLLSKVPSQRGSIQETIDLLKKQYSYLPKEIDLFSKTLEQDLNFDRTEVQRMESSYFDQIDQALETQKKGLIQRQKTMMIQEQDLQQIKQNIQAQQLKSKTQFSFFQKISSGISNIFGRFKAKPSPMNIDQTLEIPQMDQKQQSKHYLQQQRVQSIPKLNAEVSSPINTEVPQITTHVILNSSPLINTELSVLADDQEQAVADNQVIEIDQIKTLPINADMVLKQDQNLLIHPNHKERSINEHSFDHLASQVNMIGQEKAPSADMLTTLVLSKDQQYEILQQEHTINGIDHPTQSNQIMQQPQALTDHHSLTNDAVPELASHHKTLQMTKSQIFKNMSFEQFISATSDHQPAAAFTNDVLKAQEDALLDQYIEEELISAQLEQSEQFIKRLHELLNQKN